MQLDILYEDNHLLVVNKPAGIATMGAESGPTVHSLAAAYLKKKYDKPGNVYVGVVSRLDAMTSGVLVLARTSKAASRLATQFAGSGQTAAKKIYLAAIEGVLAKGENELVDYVRKDDAARRMRVVGQTAEHARLAKLRYRTIACTDNHSIVAVRLLTGRKHQIRVQFANNGHAVIGDRKYGSRKPLDHGIALHSYQLTIAHPTLREPMTWRAELPTSWNRLFGRNGFADYSDLSKVADELACSAEADKR